MVPRAGITAVVVPVPEAEPVVGRWRQRHDASAAAGMPAHVTALVPFVPATDAVVAELAALCTARPSLDVEFRRCARFPGVLYLAPEPADDLRQLTQAIWRRWPEAPPYEGRFDDVVPHLTVAADVDDGVAARIEAALAPRLPIRAALLSARLYVFDAARWACHAELPFAAATSRAIPARIARGCSRAARPAGRRRGRG
jgi:2'-5' RNA ligase